MQAAPVFLDLDASIDKALGIMIDAAARGCDLVAFGEAWLPGYPFHLWLGSPAWALQFTVRYFENSLALESTQFRRLADGARDAGIWLSIGYSERAGGSLYLGQCLIDAAGGLVSARRKLKPTHVERVLFGEGYGGDLDVVDTALGRIGALCCWEHVQPLSKYAMFSQGEQIHIAGWPAFSLYQPMAHALGREVNMAASQIYAVEGQCFVIAATSVVDQHALDILEVGLGSPPLITLGGGGAMIFGPDGRALGEAIPDREEGLVISDLDLNAITLAKAVADPAGHYAKPEVTQLVFNKTARTAVVRGSDRVASAERSDPGSAAAGNVAGEPSES